MKPALEVNEEMDSETKAYEDELDLISKSTADVNNRLEKLYDAIETGKINLDEGTLIEKRSFIRSFVKLVKVKNGEAVLEYSMPVLPDRAVIDKDGVLPTVPYGGR